MRKRYTKVRAAISFYIEHCDAIQNHSHSPPPGGNFQYFDYGTKTNRIKYGRDTPPEYDLRNVSAPFALFYAQNDWLAGPEDVGKLFDRLQSNAIGMFKVPFEQFNHVDFLWGKDAPALVYAKVLEVMGRFA